MRKIGILGLVGFLAVILAGCGGDDDDRSTFIAQTLSIQSVDGDIGLTGGTILISQANVTNNVQFGVDPGGSEFRAFLDFPLDGSNGGDAIPLDAFIVSADIDVFVNNLSFATRVPTLLDLVPFPVSGLTPTDFDSTPLLSRSPFDLLQTDINNFVRIDVTSLMVEAQRLGLRNLQLRFLLDFSAAVGFVELDDGVIDRAPLLTVEYR
jgi:hypothetical protein